MHSVDSWEIAVAIVAVSCVTRAQVCKSLDYTVYTPTEKLDLSFDPEPTQCLQLFFTLFCFFCPFALWCTCYCQT